MTSLPITTSSEEPSALDAVSHSFSKPPSPPKRRPTNLGLTILTPANTPSLPSNVRVAVPPTPSLMRPNMLRHFQSSPSLPLTSSSKILQSPSYFAASPGPMRQEYVEPLIRSDDSEPNFDIPLSKEEKPEAYPDGPICVYSPKLDLYLEPTADQALNYDVVINVASEVRNPFVATKGTEPDTNIRLDGGGGIQYAPRRTHLNTKSSSKQDLLSPVPESAPSTPGVTESPSSFQTQGPEYIHIPWEHNTDIVPDTLQLVKTIDDRINHGKKILIHCQCGVSRSATLVVAYVIYKNPTMSVQQAYDAVKKRSKWIGPNMNLIMQLQEFRTALQRTQFSSSRGLSPISPSMPASDWSLPGPHSETSNSSPKTAPLPAQTGSKPELVIHSGLANVDPGPSSAPSGSTWLSHQPEDVPPVPKLGANVTSQDTAYVDPSGNVIPVVKVIEEPKSTPHTVTKTRRDRPHSWNLDSHTRHDSHMTSHITPQVSPRSSEFAMAPLQPPKEFDSADAFGLMSPTTSGFTHSHWDRDALLGSLGMGSAVQQSVPSRKPQVQPYSHLHSVGLGRDLPLRSKLRPKMSAPSLKEQRELRTLQSEIEVKLTRHVDGQAESKGLEAALMSPRVLEFTQNPFALESEASSQSNGAVDDGDDPRSPAQKGAQPITRNIFDVL